MKKRIIKNLSLVMFVLACFTPAALMKPSEAANLTVVKVSGTITANQTWANGKVYMITNVIVPTGKTLTIQPGAIVKTAVNSTGITVNAGGVLNATGSSASRIIFTSYRDDSAGGDSNGGGTSSGVAGDYGSAVSAAGGNVTIKFATMRYGTASLDGAQGAGGVVAATDNIFNSTVKLYNRTTANLTLQRNAFTVPSNAYPIEARLSDLSTIPLSGTTKNTVTGSAKAATLYAEGSQVAAAKAWVFDLTSGFKTLSTSQLDVYGALTVNAGAVIKFVRSGSIQVLSGGVATMTGTGASRIVMTSYKDDSANGDTDGNGASSGSPDDYNLAVEARGGNIVLKFTTIKFASTALYTSNALGTGNIVLEDNLFNSPISVMQRTQSNLSIIRNQFAVSAAAGMHPLYAEGIDITSFPISGANKNTFVGAGIAVAPHIKNSQVPQNTTWDVDMSSNMGALYVEGTISVRGTVNIGAGSVIKTFNPYWYTVTGTAFSVEQGGILNSTGTGPNRVVFTSYKDDSVGGDSNGDGVSTGGSLDYSSGINSQGYLTVSFTTFRYGIRSVSVDNLQYLGFASLTNNTFGGTLTINRRSSDNLLLVRNQSTVGDTGYAMEINDTDLSAIVMTGDNKNTFGGTDIGRTVSISGSQVPSGKTWAVDNTSGMSSLFIASTMQVNGVLNIMPGVIMKVNTGYITGVNVNSGAELNILGSQAEPVKFTSIKDDSLGGDTWLDGNSRVPAPGDYGSAVNVGEGAAAAMNHFRVWYASIGLGSSGNLSITNGSVVDSRDALNVSGGSAVVEGFSASDVELGVAVGGPYISNSTYADLRSVSISNAQNGLAVSGGYVNFRGSLRNVTDNGISSCNWEIVGYECFVDATYVDWGTPDGPFANTFPTKYVCGRVAVDPWINTSGNASGSVFGTGNCNNSPTPEQRLQATIDNYIQVTTQMQNQCASGQGNQDVCDHIERTKNCMQGAYNMIDVTSPFVITRKPTLFGPGEAEVFMGDLRASGSSYLRSTAEVVPAIKATALAGNFVRVATIYHDLDSAYSSCQ